MDLVFIIELMEENMKESDKVIRCMVYLISCKFNKGMGCAIWPDGKKYFG